MKKYKLNADNFILEIEIKVFEKDIDLPVNSLLNIKINSDNFIASTTMDIDIKNFKNFSNELLRVYNSLSGSAILKETYGNNYLEFKATSKGYIYVKGFINNHCQNGFNQELKFENEFDQTHLKSFVTSINAL